jgi:hypothetical protein
MVGIPVVRPVISQAVRLHAEAYPALAKQLALSCGVKQESRAQMRTMRPVGPIGGLSESCLGLGEDLLDRTDLRGCRAYRLGYAAPHIVRIAVARGATHNID